MSAITLTSDQARINWRDTIDSAYQGDEVIIERYGKPMVAVVSYEQWQKTMQRLKKFELAKLGRKRFEEMKTQPALIITEEQYQQALQAEGLTA